MPSLTELVAALGLHGHLVARTGFCIHPSAIVRDIPKVGGTKDVRLDRLRAIGASHVLVNVDENRLETIRAIEAWPAAERPVIVVTHPQGPEDVAALIDHLVDAFADAPGLAPADQQRVRERAAALQSSLREALEATAPARRPRRRVLYLIWRDPWMTVARDTYIARMLARVNWQTLPAVDGGPTGAARYPVLRGDEPWLAEVDQVLLSSEPYAFGAAHLDEARALCPNAEVRLVDGEALSWYGPRTVDGLHLLRTLADRKPVALRSGEAAR